ncbi:glycerol-3-phosphate acyltransferase 3 isoform X1 [Aethina tumida]|uniref:glycerol-3-phosphate acyltransferase 3 isoform X1 n=1 Tax=Aethina tumida TaxID=116153 RepID=UPI00214959A0|nr:glycerol-3-phosphate acyltransferase 3 isoform X1 [Aethina tumida]
MAIVLAVVSFLSSILLTPILMLLLCIIFLASIGKSLGVRRLYVKLLLKIFEYGRQNIETARKSDKPQNEEDDEDDEGYSEEISAVPESSAVTKTPAKMLTNGYVSNGTSPLISRDDKLIMVPEPATNNTRGDDVLNLTVDENKSGEDNGQNKYDFSLSEALDYIKVGVEAIIEDQVTSRFEAEELKNWNLLIRTHRGYEFISWKLTVIWLCGFFIRYFFLFPLRVMICFFGIFWLVVSTSILGCIIDCKVKRWLIKQSYITSFRMMVRSVTGIVNIHNKQWRPATGSIVVANHTTPVDVAFLSVDNVYSLIGQRHGGFLGVLQRALARASPHIWFERSEVRDRSAVASRLKEHVSDPRNPPILIFPEGTCINNTSVMQFKKGSFEVGSIIYPVAIKYDARFGDAFWNSSKYSYVQYLAMMMTSWAIVCDVWYLPPMHQKEGETAIDFANRVKSVIAKQGGLVDLVWDGQLKRTMPKKEWRERQQEEFSKRLKTE